MSAWIALRFAAVTAWRTPALSAAVVLTIAAGVGSNTVLQSFVHGVASAANSPGTPATTTQIITVLRIAGGIVLVLTSASVTSMLLSRASTRSRDTALRVAIGARRSQLAAQLLSEGLVLAAVGGVLAVLFGIWTSQLVPALLWAPDADHLRLDVRTRDLLITAMTTIVLLTVCGLAPFLEVADKRPAAILQREGAGSSRRTQRLRACLVAAQAGGCCLFVISAHHLSSGFDAALQTSLGGVVTNPILATVGVEPVGTRAEFEARAAQYFADVREAARAATGISTTTWIVRPPGSSPNTQQFHVEAPASSHDDVVLDVRVFTGRTLQGGALSLRSGRLFSARDTPGSCKVALMSEDAAAELFGGRAVGRVVLDATGTPVEIVGVVSVRGEVPRSHRVIYYYDVQAPDVEEREARFQIPRAPHSGPVELDTNAVEGAYFTQMAIPWLVGEMPSATSANCRVGVIDRATAEQYFAAGAIGGALIDSAGRRTTITGIVQTSHLRHWQRPPLPMVYFAVGQELVPRMTLALFPTQRAESIDSEKLHEALAAVPGGFGAVRLTTLTESLSRSALAPERITRLLMMWLAGITAVLAIVGLYGVIQEAAGQRRREITLRLALGASSTQVLWQLMRSALLVAAVGAASGAMVAAVVRPTLEGAMRGGPAASYWPWLTGMAVSVAIIMLASVRPAYAVLRTDLTSLLRHS